MDEYTLHKNLHERIAELVEDNLLSEEYIDYLEGNLGILDETTELIIEKMQEILRLLITRDFSRKMRVKNMKAIKEASKKG